MLESFGLWVAQNLSWEALKKVLPANKTVELRMLREALLDTQNRNRELAEERRLMERLIAQRDEALTQAETWKRRYFEAAEIKAARKTRTKG